MMYEENAEHARQHENMRGTATGLFIALIAGVMAFAAGENEHRIVVSGFIVCAVSVLGGLINYKHYERYNLHLRRSRKYRKALEQSIPISCSVLKVNADQEHNKRYPTTERWLKLHVLWLAVYVATFLIGCVMLLWSHVVKLEPVPESKPVDLPERESQAAGSGRSLCALPLLEQALKLGSLSPTCILDRR